MSSDTTNSSTKPVVLLDVDDVLNIFPKHPNKHLRHWDDWVKTTIHEDDKDYPFTYSPTMLAALVDAVSGADVYWLTTWRASAVSKVAPTLGLPAHWTHLDADGGDDPYKLAPGIVKFTADLRPWWKFVAAKPFLESGRKVVWIDNDYRTQPMKSNFPWLRDNLLAVAPNGRIGVTPDHLSAVRTFLSD